ncbi:uncharacterized protein [Amphiura filiformis]|uniref:uncharacterized protein n=1 Tax=Amphiura filiformis TaxID=82378 RepID=UPI003B215D41
MASCYLIVSGVPTPLQQAEITPNAETPQLSDTNATIEVTPDIATHDGNVWEFVGYSGHGDISSAAKLTIQLRVADDVQLSVIPPTKAPTTTKPTTTPPTTSSPTTVSATSVRVSTASPKSSAGSSATGKGPAQPNIGLPVTDLGYGTTKAVSLTTAPTATHTSSPGASFTNNSLIIIIGAAAGAFVIIILVACIIVTVCCRKKTAKQHDTPMTSRIVNKSEETGKGNYEPPPGPTVDPAYQTLDNPRTPSQRPPRASTDHTYEPPPRRPRYSQTPGADHDYEAPPDPRSVPEQNPAYQELDGSQHQYQDLSRKPPTSKHDSDEQMSRRPPIPDIKNDYDSPRSRPLSDSNYAVPRENGTGLINAQNTQVYQNVLQATPREKNI